MSSLANAAPHPPRPSPPPAATLQGEIADLAAERQGLLQQLVAALALGSEAAEAQALALLRGQLEGSLSLLRPADPQRAAEPSVVLPRSVLAAACKAAAALQGLAEALQLQVRAAGPHCGADFAVLRP